MGNETGQHKWLFLEDGEVKETVVGAIDGPPDDLMVQGSLEGSYTDRIKLAEWQTAAEDKSLEETLPDLFDSGDEPLA
mgnify:CR=1 FL=1